MPFKKVINDRTVVVEDEICKDIEKLGIDEACNQPLHFLSSFGQLNYKQCMFLVNNLPGPFNWHAPVKRTDTDQIVMLYALTDAVVINYTMPKEGNPMFSCKTNNFCTLFEKIVRSWERLLTAIVGESKTVGSAIGEDMINHIETLLKDCSKRLAKTDYPNALNDALLVVKEARASLALLPPEKTDVGLPAVSSVDAEDVHDKSMIRKRWPSTSSESTSSSEPSSPYKNYFFAPSPSTSGSLSSLLSSPLASPLSSFLASPLSPPLVSPFSSPVASSVNSSPLLGYCSKSSSPHYNTSESSSPLCKPLNSSPLPSPVSSDQYFSWGAEKTKHDNCTCVMCAPVLRKNAGILNVIEKNCENSKHGNCSCVMCNPKQGYPISPKRSDVLHPNEQEKQKKPLLSLRIKSPSKLLSPSKYNRANSVLAYSPCGSVSSPAVNKYVCTSPISIGDSPIKHGPWCECEMCFTPPQEKLFPGSTKKSANNENSCLTLNTPNKTKSNYTKLGAKRPLMEQKAGHSEKKKPRLSESPVMSNGKINAFSFMMQSAKAKKH